jgi:hypothetical protein
MSSRFWTFVANLIPGQTARSEQVNSKFAEIDEALEKVALEMDRSIRFTYGTPTEATYQSTFSDSQRAGKSLGFDGAGALTILNAGFVWKGDWQPSTFYTVNDVVRAPAAYNYSIYLCVSAHTSTSSFNPSSWSVMIDLTEARKSLILHQLVNGPQSNYPLTAGQDVMVNVSGGAVSFLLPATPSISDQPINIMHVGGVIGDNPITINGNGKAIMGLNEPMIVDTSNASFGLAFCNDALGWRIRGV